MAADMSRMVTAITTTGRNLAIDYNAGETSDVVIKVFTYIIIAWERVENMFLTILTIITTI